MRTGIRMVRLQPDRGFRVPTTNSNTTGSTETNTIPIVTSEKLFFTIGTLPNSTPAPTHNPVHATAPTKL